MFLNPKISWILSCELRLKLRHISTIILGKDMGTWLKIWNGHNVIFDARQKYVLSRVLSCYGTPTNNTKMLKNDLENFPFHSTFLPYTCTHTHYQTNSQHSTFEIRFRIVSILLSLFISKNVTQLLLKRERK